MRRLAASLALAASAALGCGTAQAGEFTLARVAEGVYVHQGAVAITDAANAGDIANLGVIVGSRCVAVVDTGGSRAVGEALKAAIQRLTDKPVCVVINTHVHPDHVFGNAAFAGPGVAIHGHAHLAAAMAARAEAYGKGLARALGEQARRDSPLVPPTEPLAGGARTLDLGDRPLRLQAWPTAHTDGDVTVYDLTSGTLFTGDLLFVSHIPVVDGSALGWLRVLDTLRGEVPKHLVPGHGAVDPPWPGALDAERGYLAALVGDVRAALAADRSLGETVEQLGARPVEGWQLASDFHRRNLTACYTELEWESH